LAALSAAIILATAIQSLDGTIANVALPHIQGSMSATTEQITWVLTSYVVAAAICTPLTGFMVRRLGVKRVFFSALVTFTATSMLCGAALSLQEIVLFRLLQGCAGAFLVPLSQACLMDLYPKEKHGAALAAWSMGAMLAPILGPTLGGYLTEAYSWRWVFYINLPLGTFAATTVALLLPDTKPDPKANFDYMGFILLSVALGATQLMLDRGTIQDWFSSREIVVEAILAALTFSLFFVHMFTVSQPFVSRAPFKDVNFVVGLFTGFIVMMVIFATMTLQPTMLQSLMGYPVLTAGLLLMPRGFGSLTGMFLSGRLVRYIDPRLMILMGLCVIAGATWQMSHFNLDVSEQEVMLNGLCQGAGMGLVFVSLTQVTFATLDQRHRIEGVTMFGLTRNLGSAIGISMVATLLARNTQFNHAILSEHITPFNRALQMVAPGSVMQGIEGVALLNNELNRQATMMAYLDVFRVMACMVAAMMILIPFIRVPKQGAAPPPEVAAEA
jgi:DHA2 family multidrug resistance protein